MRVNENRIEEEYKEGTKKATSTSKTRKIIASKKNFMQKGRWLTDRGSKPHSYEEETSGPEEEASHIELVDKKSAGRTKTKKV